MTRTKRDVRAVLIDPDTFATTLVVLALDRYGTEALQWEPVTLRIELEQDFGAKLPNANFDRLMAGILLVTTNRFFKSLPDFVMLCNVLSGGPPDDPQADALECAWGMTEALLLWPPDEQETDPFIEEIVAYIADAVKQEGILVPPDILRIGLTGQQDWNSFSMDYTEDPAYLEGVWNMERTKTDEIDQAVKGRLQALLQQLQSLPLTNGDATGMASKMLASLKASTPQS